MSEYNINANKTPASMNSESGAYKRLPSFRTPRDLKLTEFQKIANPADAKKKIYKPNLNVQRKKQADEPVAKAAAAVAEIKMNDKFSPSDKNKREKNKKKQPNLIQTSGVFSEGLAPSMKTGRWNSRFSDSSAPSMLERPKYKGPGKVDKEEEAMVRKELLRDDFIDDPSCIPDSSQCPVRLPLISYGSDTFFKSEDDVKPFKTEEQLENKIKVKSEPGLEGEEGSEVVICNETKPRMIDDMAPLSISQLMSQSTDTSFFFFQLPHCMPKEKTFLPTSNTKQNPVKQPPPQHHQSSSSNQINNETEEKSCLKNIPEGRIGKLQLLKSGQARLVLGDAKFIVDSGTQPSFKQDVIALVDMTSASKSGNMVHIGNVTSRMIVSPDWESLLTHS